MKPFNEELAKAGAKVITRNEKPVRILCFDLKSPVYTIAAAVMVEFDGGKEEERPHSYTVTGNFYESGTESELDLFMAPEKKYVVIGVCASDGKAFTASAGAIYDCKDDALAYAKRVTQQHAGTYQVVEIEA